MAITAAATEDLQPQPSAREQRGRQIAQRGGIRQLGARYVVPTQSANSNVPTYLVDVVEQTCTCPDYALRQLPCKHYEACMFWLSWTASGPEGAVNVETEVTQVTLPKKKQQSKQNWPAYNRAQTTERLRVPQLLHALFRCVPDLKREAGTPGQKPIPTHEALFGLTMKVASGCSGRRAEADMHAYVERGYLSRAWDANTLFRAMENEALAPLLTWGIEEAAGVLAPIANKAGQIAIDATGFRTTVRRERDEKEVVIERWHDQKHKKEKGAPPKMIHDWVKLHAATDTLTNIVTAAKVTAGTGKGSGDCPHFIELLHTTNKRFTVKEVSGDKGVAGSLELRFDRVLTHNFLKGYQLYGFIDRGVVWNSGDDRNDFALTSVGGGVRLYLSDELQADVAISFPVDYRSPDNTGRHPRILFSLSKFFAHCPVMVRRSCPQVASLN